MSNTHTTHFHKCISYSFIIAGIVTLIIASQQARYSQSLAQITAGGAYTTNFDAAPQLSRPQLALAAPNQLHAAAVAQPESTGLQLVTGMLLVLIGFFFHALFVAKHPRSIPVHAAKHTKPRSALPVEFYLEEYWMEHHSN